MINFLINMQLISFCIKPSKAVTQIVLQSCCNFKRNFKQLIFPGKTSLFLLKQQKLQATAVRRHEWRSSGSMHWVSGPKAPFSLCTTVTLREVEALRGHRASPIVPHFKTDKHLLIQVGQRALFLRENLVLYLRVLQAIGLLMMQAICQKSTESVTSFPG